MALVQALAWTMAVTSPILTQGLSSAQQPDDGPQAHTVHTAPAGPPALASHPSQRPVGSNLSCHHRPFYTLPLLTHSAAGTRSLGHPGTHRLAGVCLGHSFRRLQGSLISAHISPFWLM